MAKLALTEQEKKAFSQSLGHKDVGTTFGSYGYGGFKPDQQTEIIRNIDFEGRNRKVVYNLGKEDLKQLAKELKEQG